MGCMDNKKPKPTRKNKNSIQLYADDETYIALHNYLEQTPLEHRGTIKNTVLVAIRLFLEQKGHWPPEKASKPKKESK